VSPGRQPVTLMDGCPRTNGAVDGHKVIGICQRGLALGERADLVLFRLDSETKKINVLETIVSGESLYRAAT
jgi:hypothetical protein